MAERCGWRGLAISRRMFTKFLHPAFGTLCLLSPNPETLSVTLTREQTSSSVCSTEGEATQLPGMGI